MEYYRDALLNAAASGALAEATNGRVARVTDSPENTHPHPTNQVTLYKLIFYFWCCMIYFLWIGGQQSSKWRDNNRIDKIFIALKECAI